MYILSGIMNEWNKIRLNYINGKFIPNKNGIYLIINIQKWISGIPINLKVEYVGIGNLKARFKDHSSITREHNFLLVKKIQKEKLEFWFQEHERQGLRDFEDKLITEFTETNPHLTNILGKPKKNKLNQKGEKTDARQY